MEDTLASEKIRAYDKMVSDKAVLTSHCQDISLYTLPSRDFYNSKVPGQKRNARIFDTTAMHANEQLANGLHSMLTSPNTRWFALKPADPKARLDYESKVWIDETEKRMYDIFNSADGSFNTQVHEMYLELCAFGTGVLYCDYRGGKIRFRARTLSDCYIRENDYGIVDTVYRMTRVTVHAAQQFFGEATPQSWLDKLKKNPMELVRILHTVEPRTNVSGYSPYKSGKPFQSCFINLDEKVVIQEGGYDSLPYMCPRFGKRSGEEYGFGPGMTAYPETRVANRLKELILRGTEKLVDPVTLVPDDGSVSPLVLNAGGIITYRAGGDKPTPYQTGSQPKIAQDIIMGIQAKIMELYYVDWLNLPQGPQMTATEVLDRRDKNFRMLGPMLARQQSEFTGPLIDRVYNLMMMNGLLPAIPRGMAGKQLKIEYMSPIAQAQRFAQLESINRTFQSAAAYAQFDPSIWDNFKKDDIIRFIGNDINNMPEKLMTSPQEMATIRQARADQQQKQQEAEMVVNATKALQYGANAATSVQKLTQPAQAG